MTDEQELHEQEQSKKAWTTPDLTVYGTVEELTKGRPGTNSVDVASGNGRPAKSPPKTPTRTP